MAAAGDYPCDPQVAAKHPMPGVRWKSGALAPRAGVGNVLPFRAGGLRRGLKPYFEELRSRGRGPKEPLFHCVRASGPYRTQYVENALDFRPSTFRSAT